MNDKERVFAALENANLLSKFSSVFSNELLGIVNKGLLKAEKGFDEYLKLLKINSWTKIRHTI